MRSIFCGCKVFLKPFLLKQHIDGDLKPSKGRNCAPCTPASQHARRHRLIKGELRRRTRLEEEKNIADAKKARELADSADGGSAVYGKVKKQKVDEQWTRALIKNGLPIHVMDDEEFRKSCWYDGFVWRGICGWLWQDTSAASHNVHKQVDSSHGKKA